MNLLELIVMSLFSFIGLAIIILVILWFVDLWKNR